MAKYMPQINTSKFILFVFIYTLIASHSSFAAHNDLPILGDSSSGFVSPAQEHALGRAWLRQLRAQATTIDDPLTTSFIEDLIYRIAPHSEVQDHRFEFVVIDQKELNAFAVPGGIIGINLGLFLHAKDEDEVSSVLAHELAHLSQRHFARQIENSERQAPIAIASLLASILLIVSNNADAGFAGLVASQAASIQSQLAYSRDWEREADREGMKTLVDSGLDPNAMSTMFEGMLNATRYSQRPPEFLLTHPVTDSRISDAGNRVAAYPTKKRTKSFNFLILQQRAQLKYSIADTNRDAFFIKALQNTDNLDEEDSYRYSLGSIKFETRQYQKALNYLNTISEKNSDQPATIILKSKALNELEKSEEAIELLNKAYQLRPDNYAIAISLAQIMSQHGQAEAALADLQRWAEKRGTDPNIWNQLAEIANKANNLLVAYRAKSEYFFLNGEKYKALRQLQLAVDSAAKQGSFQQHARLKQRLIQMSESKESLSL